MMIRSRDSETGTNSVRVADAERARPAYALPSARVSSGAAGTGRITPLDGLRGIALLLVFVHNVGGVTGELTGLPIKLYGAIVNTGWIGVQLFFALSGFLITRILLESKGGPGYFRRFYARRTLRIFPVAYALLAVVFLVAPHVSVLQPLTERAARSSLWYWSYLANWMLPFHGTVGALSHFWSLAVEEQFYLIWPALVLALRERALAVLCGVMIVAAPVVRALLFVVFPADTAGSAAYNWTIARCDALAMGALVAVLLSHPTQLAQVARWAGRIAVAGTAVLAAMFVVLHGFNGLEFPVVTVGQSVVGVVSTCLVVLCIAPVDSMPSATRLRWLLSRRWLVAIGTYSYALYLFHVPLDRMLRPYTGTLLTSGSAGSRLGYYALYLLLMFVLTYALALVSWHAIEQPFLRLKRFFPMPRVQTATSA